MNINDLIQKLDKKSVRKIKIPTKDDIIQMLYAEEKIRFSPEYIKLCDDVANEVNGWLRISKEFQYKIVSDYGFITDVEKDIAVNHMRRAQYIYPDEPLFKTIPVYVRNNLAQKGIFKTNDIIPNIKIHNMDLSTLDLYSTFNPDKLNILIASSHT